MSNFSVLADGRVLDVSPMKTLLAVLAFLTMASQTIADDLQVYEGYTKQYGDYYEEPDNSGRMLENQDYHWKPGSYLKDDGSGRLQQYDSYTPTYGTYYDEDGQYYENFVPKYGDRLKKK